MNDSTDCNAIKPDFAQVNADWARGRLALMTEEELAAALRLNSVTTLATWRSQGKGPTYAKLGKRVFYTIADIVEWVDRERIVPTPTAANDNISRAEAA